MNHPYLRAYMAGIAVPTAFLLVVMTIFTRTIRVRRAVTD
jgi:hypothetical protein